MLARIRKALDEKEEGFTLIELLVVIIIIGILAAIAIPVFLSQRKKGYDSQSKSDLRNIATAQESVLTDSNAYTACTTAAACLTALGSSQGLKLSSNDKIWVGVDSTNKGYCALATSQSGNTFVYDSENGGLQSTVYSTVPTTVSGGACGAVTLGTPG